MQICISTNANKRYNFILKKINKNKKILQTFTSD